MTRKLTIGIIFFKFVYTSKGTLRDVVVLYEGIMKQNEGSELLRTSGLKGK